MKVLFVASEVAPFAKTGGLADVAGALPKALSRLGHELRIVLPRYRAIDPSLTGLRRLLEALPVMLDGRDVTVSVWEARLPSTDIPVWLIDEPSLFDREGLYQDGSEDYPDNLARFSVFSQAALAAARRIGWAPQIVHAHDWQAALVCAHLALRLRADPFWREVRSVLTIHNLAYQGVFPAAQFPLTQLPPSAFGVEGLEFYGQVNCLKGGLIFADRLTTVSPTYAQDIQTPEFGCGLEGVLQRRREELTGILNGIATEEWDPQTDPHIVARYSASQVAGKSACKAALKRRLGLPPSTGLLIGMVQRLAEQKGIDIFLDAIDDVLRLGVQVALLGTGEPRYHEQLTTLARRHPGQIGVTLGFDQALAHQIEAGADAFLMPSRFEPCGLNPMYSMRYGTVPIARKVGGLNDTVTDVSAATVRDGSATGFVFEPYTARALLDAVARSVAAFRDSALWSQLMRTGMRQDFSWTRAAAAYARVYEDALAAPKPVAGGGSEEVRK